MAWCFSTRASVATVLSMHSCISSCLWVNSLGPSDAIWRWRSWSTLVQVMACCLTAPSHYLNQCWLITSKVLWYSSEDIIIRRFEDTNQYIFKITLRSPKGQWANGYLWFTCVLQCCFTSTRIIVGFLCASPTALLNVRTSFMIADGLMPSDTKPVPQLMLTKFYDATKGLVAHKWNFVKIPFALFFFFIPMM